MNLDPEQIGQVQHMLSTSGWRIFCRYIQERIDNASEFAIPDDVFTFLSREQQFGKREELELIIPEFVEILTREKNKHE